LGLASFASPKEQAVDREAQANLKLISSAEKIYRMETNVYVPCNNTTEINAFLRLMIPTSDNNWKYKINTTSGNTSFSARALRTSGPYKNTKILCINETQDNYTNTSCGSAW